MQPMDANTEVGAEEALSLLRESSGVMSRCAEDSRKVAASIDRATKVSVWSQVTELVALFYQVYLAWKCYLSLDDISVDSIVDSGFLILISFISHSVAVVAIVTANRRKLKQYLLTLSAVSNGDTDSELGKSAESTPPAEPSSVFDGEGVQRIAEESAKWLALVCGVEFSGILFKAMLTFFCVYFAGPFRGCLSWLSAVFILPHAVVLVQLWRCRRQLKTFLGSLQRRLEV